MNCVRVHIMIHAWQHEHQLCGVAPKRHMGVGGGAHTLLHMASTPTANPTHVRKRHMGAGGGAHTLLLPPQPTPRICANVLREPMGAAVTSRAVQGLKVWQKRGRFFTLLPRPQQLR